MAQAILCIFLELPEEEDGWGGGARTSCSPCPTLSSFLDSQPETCLPAPPAEGCDSFLFGSDQC